MVDNDQPVAGPSRPTYHTLSHSRISSSRSARRVPFCELGDQCPLLFTSTPTPVSPLLEQPLLQLSNTPRGNEGKKEKRQGHSYTAKSNISSSSASSTSDGLFQGPASTPYTITSYLPTTTSNTYSTITASSGVSDNASESNLPWTYTATQTYDSTAASAQTSFVPGVILNLTLAGDSDSEAVYSVPMTFGHASEGSSDAVLSARGRFDSDWDGGDPQTFNLQIDLGSSDLVSGFKIVWSSYLTDFKWLSSDTCTTSSCTSAPALFNASQSLDAGVGASLAYQAGSISGEIYWEEVELGSFGIGYQAFSE